MVFTSVLEVQGKLFHKRFRVPVTKFLQFGEFKNDIWHGLANLAMCPPQFRQDDATATLLEIIIYSGG
jgi:hypothetical protein